MSIEEMDFTDDRMIRKQAEEKLKEQQKSMDTSAYEADVKKLLHELQVHQIELEMQNEELRRANETAETMLKKYTLLYDFAPMGYFTLESDSTIIEINFTGAEMLGDKRIGLEGSQFKLFVSDDSLPVFNNFLSRVFTGKEKESCEVKLGYDNTPLCHAYLEGVVIDDNKQCLMSAVDISKFTKA